MDITRVVDPMAFALRYAHTLKNIPCYITRDEGTGVVTVQRSDGSGIARRFGPETHHMRCSRLVATMELVDDALRVDSRRTR